MAKPNGTPMLDNWHKETSHGFDLGGLYTMIAGLLNYLVIFDAYSGPLPSSSLEKRNRHPPPLTQRNRSARRYDMMDRMRILELFRSRFEAALTGLVSDTHGHAQRVALSKENSHGDYQANLAMGVAKELRKDSVEVANEVLGRLQWDDLCEGVDVAGRGFINLRLSKKWILDQLRRVGTDEHLGIAKVAPPKTYVIDYSSPNVAKPMHVGHIRSTVIGDAIAKTLRFLGHRVLSDNHLGDWGTQFGMVIYGYKHFRDDQAFQEAPVHELSRLYRLVQQIIGYQEALDALPTKRKELETKRTFLEASQQAVQAQPEDKKLLKALKANERAAEEASAKVQELEEKVESFSADPQAVAWSSKHPQLGQRVLAETAKLHDGDPENNQLWRDFLPHCKEEIHRVYQRLHVTFDYELGESYYHPMLGEVVEKLKKLGIATESDGATCVFLENFDAPMIVRKQDGAFLYATTDLATIDYRIEHFHPDAILYVVDHRQSEHFVKLFAVAQRIGISHLTLKHVSFGTVLGKDGKPFKTDRDRSSDLTTSSTRRSSGLSMSSRPPAMKPSAMKRNATSRKSSASEPSSTPISCTIEPAIMSSTSTKWSNSRETPRPTFNTVTRVHKAFCEKET